MAERLRVLQIEDSESDAELIAHLLEKAGFSIFASRVDDAAGLDAALADVWDVIICDYRMPGFSAPAALRIVQGSGRDIPFIIVSASIGEAIAVEMMKAGAHDYVMKSNLARLAPAVEREVREARTRADRRRAEERLALAITATQLGTFDFDPQTRDLVWSEITRRHFGLPSDAPVTYEIALLGIHPEDRSRVERVMETVVQPESGGHYAAEYRTVGLEDGVQRWISSVGRVFFDAQNRPVRFVGVTQDITERRKLEEQVWQSQKLDSIGRLAGGVAHDFNNLLTVIIGCTEMMRSEVAAGGFLRESLDEISTCSARAAALTRQLLTFSRRQLTQPKNFALNELVANLEKMIRRMIGEDIDLVLSLDPEAGVLRADPAQVEQVVVNLVVNARDAISGSGTVTIGTARHFGDVGALVALTVTDSGAGMTEEVKAHIFEPFFTTKEVGKGTGLGLATVYGIVKQSGGSIAVTSRPGEGCSMQILFPAIDGAADDTLAASTPALERRNETILLAEDEPKLREFVRRVLTRQGYTVLEAGNGNNALEISRQHPGAIDLLLADIVMPQMSGPELAEKFSSERPGVPILFMSGHTDHRALLDGVPPAYLQKPFTAVALLARLQAALDENK